MMKIRIIGPAHLYTGLAIHTRLVSEALAAQDGVEIIINPYHETRFRSQNIYGLSHFTDEHVDVNIFCMNYPSIKRISNEMPFVFRSAKKNICFGAWELERIPEAFHKLHEVVDAYFAQSKFVQNAFKEINLPIYYTPLSISSKVLNSESILSNYRTSAEKFRFLFIFSVDSMMSRKNPRAIFESFKLAFGDDKSVELNIKFSATRINDKNYGLFCNLKSEAEKFPNVKFFEKNMSEDEYINFIKSYSCYVSLHRSEGFGLTILESIGCDVPCITTNYSGNLDFCNANNSILVPYNYIELKEGDYHGQMQRWADPSIESAANAMISISKGTLFQENIADTIKEFHPKNIGKLYIDSISDVLSS